MLMRDLRTKERVGHGERQPLVVCFGPGDGWCRLGAMAFTPKRWAVLGIAILLAIFIFQNTQLVQVRFLF